MSSCSPSRSFEDGRHRPSSIDRSIVIAAPQPPLFRRLLRRCPTVASTTTRRTAAAPQSTPDEIVSLTERTTLERVRSIPDGLSARATSSPATVVALVLAVLVFLRRRRHRRCRRLHRCCRARHRFCRRRRRSDEGSFESNSKIIRFQCADTGFNLKSPLRLARVAAAASPGDEKTEMDDFLVLIGSCCLPRDYYELRFR